MQRSADCTRRVLSVARWWRLATSACDSCDKSLVPMAGLEPARCRHRLISSPIPADQTSPSKSEQTTSFARIFQQLPDARRAERELARLNAERAERIGDRVRHHAADRDD